jgi:hypothetical protein
MKPAIAAASLFGALVAVGNVVLCLAPPANADVFDMCPDGREGVVGGHTSCGFAQNVRSGYFLWGTHFNALSPTTGLWYEVNCDPRLRPAVFSSGASLPSINCYASSNAEVVILP